MTAPTLTTGDVDQVLVDFLTDYSGLDPATGIPIRPGSAGDPHGLIARAQRPGLMAWLEQAARLKGCTRPIRLRGDVTTMDGSGNVIETFSTDTLPDQVLYKPCGTRFASLCKPCSETYRWDVYQLIRAGLSGGKGVPDTVSTHPAVFPTFTAPSFGPVHARVVDPRTGKPKPCHPRRDQPMCPHGRPLSCPYLHHEHDPRIGKPLCLDCYDHDHQVVWNHFAPKLWDRTMVKLRRLVAAELGDELAAITRLSFVKIAEMQTRAAVHLHALIRFDGYDPDQPTLVLAPPRVELPDGTSMPVLSAERLAELVLQAARSVGLITPSHPDRPEGWLIRWGTQVLAKVVHRGLDGGELTEGHVSAYLAKYSTKGSEAAGLVATRITQATIGAYADHNSHVGRLIEACWRLGRLQPGRSLLDQDGRPYKGLRRWAHMFGYGGHFSSKSRRYAYNLSKPRRERIRVARAIAQGLDPTQLADTDNQATTVVIGQWRYVGTGWLTTGDAALAAMAADAARRRRPAGLTSAEPA